MSRFYGPADADALVPQLQALVTRLRESRDELLRLREAFQARDGEVAGDGLAGLPSPEDDDPELRTIRLRMRGIVDRMAADVAWLDDRDIVLRDIATGLLDLPALAAGQPVWLCWRSGEDHVGWWHGTDEGFAGRQPLAAMSHGTARA